MKRFKIILILIGIIGSTSFSCDKNYNLLNNQTSSGLILNYGDPSVDGCGWMIEIDKIVYSPTSLDSVYKKDSLKVILDYQVLSSVWNCGWRSPGYKQIEIKTIKKQ